MTVVY